MRLKNTAVMSREDKHKQLYFPKNCVQATMACKSVVYRIYEYKTGKQQKTMYVYGTKLWFTVKRMSYIPVCGGSPTVAVHKLWLLSS